MPVSFLHPRQTAGSLRAWLSNSRLGAHRSPNTSLLVQPMNSSEPTSLIGYGVGAIGTIFGFIQFFMRIRSDKALLLIQHQRNAEDALRDRRYKVYSEYLQKLDSINGSLTDSYSSTDFQTEINKLHQAARGGSDFRTAQQEYFKFISRLTAQWGNARTKALEELSGLRLVSSPPILTLLNQYTDLTNALIGSLGEMMQKVGTNPELLQDLTTGDRVKQIHSDLSLSLDPFLEPG